MDNSDLLEVYKSIEGRLFQWVCNVFSEFGKLQNATSLYYYTDMNALINGIIVPNPEVGKEICLWATKWSHLNDKEEIIAGLRQLKKILPNDVVGLFQQLTANNHSISFSLEKDFLPMWSMYGRNGGGVMLEFDVKGLLDLYGEKLMPCVYEHTLYSEEVLQKLRSMEYGDDFVSLSDKQKVLATAIIGQMFLGVFKNSSFKYEREVRIVAIGNPHGYESKVRMEKYRVRDGVLTPYLEEFIPKSCLKTIWLGPTVDKKLSRETLQAFLNSRNVKVDVKCSKIPFRG